MGLLFNCCRVYLFLVLLLSFSDVFGVDKSKFKTCEQSSFCRRCRKMEVDKSVYELDLEVVERNDEHLRTVLVNTEEKVSFNLYLSALADDTIRLQVTEAEPLRHRYYPSVVLDGTPSPDRLSVVSQSEKTVEVVISGHKVILTAHPFRIDIYDKAGQEVVISLNSRGLFRYEHTRNKPSGEGEDGGEELRQQQEAGLWEENFSSHHDSKPHGPTAVSADFSFPGASVAYGLPEHADSLHLRTTTKEEPYRFYNLDVFEYELDSTMALYAAIPFLLAHSPERSSGVFWMNPSETWVDVENEGSTVVSSLVSLVSGSKPSVHSHFMSESGDIDVFFLLGPTPHDVVRQYIKLVGLPALPPMFSLAYHQCRWNYISQEDVDTVHKNFDKYNIPMDVMWLDIEHTDNKKYFTWDPYKFSDPTAMQHNLTARGRKLVVIVDPHIKRESGYFLHDDATANGYYVKNKDNSDYEGWCWPGSSSYLDLLSPAVQDYYSSRYHLDHYTGSTQDLHVWNDMNEPSVFNGPEVTMPKDNIHHGGWEHRELHNLYGLYHVMGTYRGMVERSGGSSLEETKRPFILTRSAFSGSQRYTAIWTGDNAAEWSHLRASLPMCLSLSLAGFSFCGADVGGFFNNPQTELLIRWYQAGAYLGFYRAHAHIDTKRREPWLFGDETTSLIRDAIRERYSLLPLWYTLFHQLNQTGTPVIRPLFLEFPQDKNTFLIGDQLLVGNSLLVKPVMEQGVGQISVYLPSGDSVLWYDFHSYTVFPAGTHTLPVTMATIPVFQQGGTIVPKKERVRRSSQLMKNDPYTLIVAPNSKNQAEGRLYVDDGETHRFKYRKDSSIELLFSYDNTSLTSRVVGESHYDTSAWLERVVILGASHLSSVSSALLTTSDGQTSSIITRYDKATNTLTIRKPAVNINKQWTITLK